MPDTLPGLRADETPLRVGPGPKIRKKYLLVASTNLLSCYFPGGPRPSRALFSKRVAEIRIGSYGTYRALRPEAGGTMTMTDLAAIVRETRADRFDAGAAPRLTGR